MILLSLTFIPQSQHSGVGSVLLTVKQVLPFFFFFEGVFIFRQLMVLLVKIACLEKCYCTRSLNYVFRDESGHFSFLSFSVDWEHTTPTLWVVMTYRCHCACKELSRVPGEPVVKSSTYLLISQQVILKAWNLNPAPQV